MRMQISKDRGIVSDTLFSVSREVVVITGAAGQLGYQYASVFLRGGARVIGLDLNPSPAADDLGNKYCSHFRFFTCNVTRIDSLRDSLESIRSCFGEPTVLINNAAIDSPPDAPLEETGPFEQYPDSSWDRVMDVNVKGVYLACKVFGAAMAANRRGSIINVSSIYGVVSPDQSIYEYRRQRGETFYKPVAYAVSKSALLNLTRYLAVYWAKHSVRVNTLVIAGVENGQAAEFMKAYCDRIPVGRMASQDEYNGAVLFLASQASSYMTGAQLVIDGGWTAI
jgi:NAD(P)-dependent dehydrogenase (short-subunit alcohol dehydrogenase family)